MKKFLFFLLLATNVFSQDIWVIGKSYLSHFENEKQHLLTSRKADSWGYDETNCRLWITDQNTLYSMDRIKRSHRGEAQKILSEIKESFLTLGLTGQIELRDTEGRVQKTFSPPWRSLPFSIVHTKNFNFTLTENEKTLELSIYDSEFKPLVEIPVRMCSYSWNTPKLLVDEKNEAVWIGYTTSQPWTMYAPVIERRNFKGELLYKKEWKERGVLFDLCLEEDGTVLASRDIPSNSGYTVPVYSFLERLSLSNSVSTVFAHRENLFIDSLSCKKNETTFISRSIFSSDPPPIEIWDKTAKNMSKTLLKLPDPAWKIYSCLVQ